MVHVDSLSVRLQGVMRPICRSCGREPHPRNDASLPGPLLLITAEFDARVYPYVTDSTVSASRMMGAHTDVDGAELARVPWRVCVPVGLTRRGPHTPHRVKFSVSLSEPSSISAYDEAQDPSRRRSTATPACVAQTAGASPTTQMR